MSKGDAYSGTRALSPVVPGASPGIVCGPERRRVQPRVLVCVNHAWYIVTYDPEREGKQRTFALYRMRDAEDTRVPFKPRGQIDLGEVLRHSLGIHTGGETARVELRFRKEAADLAREEFWHDTEAFTRAPMRVSQGVDAAATVFGYLSSSE
jgi:predicted DNA-binding transcriptional regulator YafY